jgi:hypothetical protein
MYSCARVWYSTVVKSTFLSLCYLRLLVNVKSAINASQCATSDYTLHRGQTGDTHLLALSLFLPSLISFLLILRLFLLFFLLILLLILHLFLLPFLILFLLHILLLFLLHFLLPILPFLLHISRVGPTLSRGHTCISMHITAQFEFCLSRFHHQH